jgi:hypothetical protein
VSVAANRTDAGNRIVNVTASHGQWRLHASHTVTDTSNGNISSKTSTTISVVPTATSSSQHQSITIVDNAAANPYPSPVTVGGMGCRDQVMVT